MNIDLTVIWALIIVVAVFIYVVLDGFDLGIVILAYVLGPIFERSVRQSLAISDGDPMIFLHSYLSAGFAIVAVALLMGAVRSGTGTVSLLLMGVAINAIAAALISLVLALSPNPFAYQEISLWLAGSIVDRDLHYLAMAAPFMILGAAIVLGAGRWLDALSLGEDTARSLGADTRSLGLRLTLGVGLMVGAATSVAGVIGFVGLIAPHLVRARVGFRPGATLVPSMLVGAALVLGADIVVRLLPTASELQLGVFTSLVGAPFLVRAVRKAHAAWLAT